MLALKFTFFSSLFFLFSLLPTLYAHAGVAPQLGVNGKPKRSDAKRPSKNQPCGNGVNIASALDTSTAVPVSANEDVKVTVLNFNAGADGSREVKAKIDPSGTGKSFVSMTMTANGDPVPKENAGSQDVIAKLPAGTKCTGGSEKNRCLVQFVTTSGFGNCVVVSQGIDAAGKNSSTSSDARAIGPGVDISDRASEGPDTPARTDKEGGEGGDEKNPQKEKVAAGGDGVKAEENKGDNSGKEKKDKKKDKKKGQKKEKGTKSNSDKGKGQSGKNNTDKKKQKKGESEKRAGTRAPRALLADLRRDELAVEIGLL